MGRSSWKLAKGMTWKQKLHESHPNHGKIIEIPPELQPRFGKGSMVIPKPLDLDALIRKVKKGRLVTIKQLRSRIAADCGTDYTCPLTTGIILRIIAEAAEEDRADGKKRITPYWRVIRDDGALNDKIPGGAGAQATKLRQEGFKIERAGRSGKELRVRDFQSYLVRIQSI